jgi:hypothetical protein
MVNLQNSGFHTLVSTSFTLPIAANPSTILDKGGIAYVGLFM